MHRAATTIRTGVIEIGETELPPQRDGEAVVRVEAVGICGTDLHVFDGSYPTDFPVIQGHEFAGTIVSLPSDHTGELTIGTRVSVEPVTACGHCPVCRQGASNVCDDMVAIGIHRPGGLQEFVTVPVANCHPTADLPPETAALCEPMSVSLRGVLRAGVGAGEKVLVLGCGPIGLGAVIAAVDRGAEVMAVDLQRSRLDLARELGAVATAPGLDDLVPALRPWAKEGGPAVVIEATGVPRVAEAAFDVVAPAGRIAMVGVSERTMSVNIRTFTRKELTVVGSRATRDFAGAVALVQRRRAEVARLISREFDLTEAPAALRFSLDHPDQTIKTLVRVG